MEVRFCPGCSQVVHSHYIYCPQCGASLHVTPDLDELLDKCLRPLEEMEQRNSVHRLELLLSRLVLLEEGLGLLLGEEQVSACR
ncbi:MAG: hypothetical protein WCG80_06990 [Spirochaetales bacterium]